MRPKKYVEFNGETYQLVGKYYFLKSSTNEGRKNAKQLHKAVWEYYNGREVPDGYHVHHKDFNCYNNDISNLEILPAKEHLALHGKEVCRKHRKELLKHLDKIRDKASEWHKSEEGKEWHKEHVKNSLAKAWNFREERVCEQCGESYVAKQPFQRFCSDLCANRARSKTYGKTFINTCVICGEQFEVNAKQRNKKYCSNKCRNKANWLQKKAKREQNKQ